MVFCSTKSTYGNDDCNEIHGYKAANGNKVGSFSSQPDLPSWSSLDICDCTAQFFEKKGVAVQKVVGDRMVTENSFKCMPKTNITSQINNRLWIFNPNNGAWVACPRDAQGVDSSRGCYKRGNAPSYVSGDTRIFTNITANSIDELAWPAQ
jgi:hypothetical protein